MDPRPVERGEGPALTAVTLECHSPQLVLNGLLWLSAGRPTVADALPNLDDWIAGLRSIPLRTVDRGRELFPSARDRRTEFIRLRAPGR